MAVIEETKKQQVMDELIWDASVDATNIQVDVIDGTARLTGSVPSYSEKMWAETDAYSIPGIIDVENLLRVEYPSTVVLPTDTEIESNIRTMLNFDNSVDATGIIVNVENGIATLTGYVPSTWQKIQAGDIAQSATGVLGIKNKLDITLGRSYIDLDIENDIRNAFIRNSIVDSDRISVSVSNGVVTLSGTQPTYTAKRTARNIAYYTSGVIDVIDNIAILY